MLFQGAHPIAAQHACEKPSRVGLEDSCNANNYV